MCTVLVSFEIIIFFVHINANVYLCIWNRISFTPSRRVNILLMAVGALSFFVFQEPGALFSLSFFCSFHPALVLQPKI